MRAAVLAISLAVIGALAQAQTPQTPNHRTVWSGVFTTAQAEHGASLYKDRCESCHGGELRGNEGPALMGPSFNRNWIGLTLRELFRHIKVAMPEDAPSSVSDADKLDILAFILQKNGFPVGSQPLTVDPPGLAAITFEGQNGPEPPPTGATVLTVGCLASVATNVWTLTQASEPVRTTLEAVHDPDVHDTSGIPLGTATLRLIGMPKTNLQHGQRVAVIGLMTRASSPSQTDGINVLELSEVAGECVR